MILIESLAWCKGSFSKKIVSMGENGYEAIYVTIQQKTLKFGKDAKVSDTA